MLYLFLADGFEETEALAPLDCIRRAGISVLTVGLEDRIVTGSHGVTVHADIAPEDVDLTSCEGVFLPGGPGTERLYASDTVKDMVAFCAENQKLVASICAAPSVPGRMGLLQGRKAVCFPGYEEYLTGRIPCDDSVVTDGCFITAKGAGCVFPFAHAVITYLKDKETAERVLRTMQYAGM